jgi:glycosyltransferase involved in cell wall biosynthesis
MRNTEHRSKYLQQVSLPTGAAQLMLNPRQMYTEVGCEVSVVMPFADDEEAIGTAARNLAEAMRSLAVTFELLAVDEDSSDNSHAVLAMLRAEVPELRVIHAPGRGKGIDTGTSKAIGKVIVIMSPTAAASTAGLADATARVRSGDADAEVALGRFTVADRSKSIASFRGVKAIGDAMHRRLVSRLQLARLNVRVAGGAAPVIKRGFRAFARSSFSRW